MQRGSLVIEAKDSWRLGIWYFELQQGWPWPL